jgi:hypothetical protein
MMRCPCCEGEGWFPSHADGCKTEDCEICQGRGLVFEGMREIRRLIRMPKYVIDCRQCGKENHFRDTSCSGCGYGFT